MKKRNIAGAAVAAIALTLVAATPAYAGGKGTLVCYTPDTTIQITEYVPDFDYSETRSHGGYDVLSTRKLHIYTVDATSEAKVALYKYFAAPQSISAVSNFSLSYDVATGPRPGGQLLVDLDGDGDPTGYLVIEPVYNGGIWLSANWDGIDPATLPVSAVGGGGLDWATFSEWAAAFPNAKVTAYGFSLGSGVYGAGVLNYVVAGTTPADDFVKPVVTTQVIPGTPYTCNKNGKPVR